MNTYRVTAIFDVIAESAIEAGDHVERALLDGGDAINEAQPDEPAGTQIAGWEVIATEVAADRGG